MKSQRMKVPKYRRSQLDPNAVKEKLDALRKGIEVIFRKEHSNLSYEELYRSAYALVIQKKADQLFKMVEDLIADHVDLLAGKMMSHHEDELLRMVAEIWKDFCKCTGMIKDVLLYMDSTDDKVPSTQRGRQAQYSIRMLSLRIWTAKIMSNESIGPNITRLLLACISRERNGELIDTDSMKACISMMIDLEKDTLSLYRSMFENDFLEETSQFFRCEAQEFIANSTTVEYLRKVSKRFKEEEGRANLYLHVGRTLEPLLQRVAEELIKANAFDLVTSDTGCEVLLRNSDYDNLLLMYELFSHKPKSTDAMLSYLSGYIKEHGMKIVTECKTEPVRFVDELLELHTRISMISDRSFKKDHDFQKSIKEAFEVLMNAEEFCARNLSFYMDRFMNRSARTLSDTEIDEVLNNVIRLFRYLQDKDVFEDFARKSLGKRVLMKSSVDNDVEKKFISKLKNECGHTYTHKMENMFKDVDASHRLLPLFLENTMDDREGLPDINVSVCATGSWPAQDHGECALPDELSVLKAYFTNFYETKHQGRRLNFSSSQGNVEVKYQCSNGISMTLVMSVYQATILQLFNNRDTVSYGDIAQQTNIPSEELQRHLISLTAPGYRILIKSTSGVSIANDSELFTINDKFRCPRRRLVIKLIKRVSKETKAPSNAIPKEVEDNRKYAMQAALVRVMKSRKSLMHQELINEVIHQLESKFVPSIAKLKQAIESLIERDYIERDEDEHNRYRYVA
eukprot:TRINITY_DN184_c0_g3_i2.p1 TRINITY_DN184_c0_g3~~TRINITY_DN184_c0_g3_i2.p1  ORF type:complete len:739 (+),score=206.46 TRINITY_DN184_c0_g3_i2:70-2286(+)